ncbi:MAG TPA: helix-turn-helix transcriptional regulator, partial [Bacteroidales bacterium]|nr:helix-turn-helix transcriptional regulator [Bacteroidales bacterium]
SGGQAVTNNLRVERAIKNITQQQLADELKVSRQTINAIELGKYVPSTLLALKIARYFQKPLEEIFSLGPED